MNQSFAILVGNCFYSINTKEGLELSKNRLNLLVLRCLAYIGVVAFIYCASPVFLPSKYVTIKFTEGYAETAPWMFLVGGFLFLVFGLISIAVLSRPRVEPDCLFGIIFWGIIGYVFALFLFCLPTVVVIQFSILTADQAQIAGAVLCALWVMLIYNIFTACFTERKPRDSRKLPRRPKPLPPPKGAIRDDSAMRAFLFKE